ncbi:hypothetical protein MSBRW_2502 [Methanosarcina barkeri str. Wiesmoor]|uniref:Uncharacterized protein n=2 Tax=Methanosarcina barkeri TaxID=2208 RepID=A0A0E3QNT6_METBA|nr:hypothetical protein [Methanosarcina barkeri]AKB51755.1 hypothetical protein MSBRW_2502 [Methanosarcina barkeri str. Wiesmoor]
MANEIADKLREKENSGKVSDNSDIALKRSTVQALINPTTDAMYDLSQQQITAMSLYESVDKFVIPIPGVICFMNRAASLSASRDRLGRQEAVNTIIPRPVIPTLYPQIDPNQPPKKSFFSFLKKRNSQQSGGSQDAER